MSVFRGPIFDGSAQVIVSDMCDDIERAVSAEGESMVLAELGRVLREPTGYYESRITTQPSGAGIDVTDQGVIYGHWLEGTGSRNSPNTRFKGYATFRRTRQALDAKAVQVAQPVVDQHVGRLG